MSLRIWIHLANKNAGKALVSVGGGGIMTILLLHRVVNMKRSRTEVGRWRMQRQASRRKSRWLEGQSRRNMRIHSIRKCILNKQRNSLLFAILQYLNVLGTIAVPNKFTLPSLNSIFAPILYCQLSFLVHRYR